MNENDKELLKTFPSMFKGVAVQAAQLNGNQNASLSIKDACGMARFGWRTGSQDGRVGTVVSPAVKNISPKHLR